MPTRRAQQKIPFPPPLRHIKFRPCIEQKAVRWMCIKLHGWKHTYFSADWMTPGSISATTVGTLVDIHSQSLRQNSRARALKIIAATQEQSDGSWTPRIILRTRWFNQRDEHVLVRTAWVTRPTRFTTFGRGPKHLRITGQEPRRYSEKLFINLKIILRIKWRKEAYKCQRAEIAFCIGTVLGRFDTTTATIRQFH
jgi:hypothetical protein